MNLIKLLSYIKGFLCINVKGLFIERFINICMNRNIYLWDIKRCGKNDVNMKISIKGFKMLRPIVRKTHTKVKILERKGLPFFLSKHKKRRAFLIGAIIAAVLFCYTSSFIWVIDVVGNETVPSEQIIESLRKNGFEKGDLRYAIDVPTLQNRVLLDIDNLSWLWVNIKGTKATVEVREKKPAPEIIDKDKPCNIIAKKSGLITAIAAKSGQKVVFVGDTVEKGDLLVSGIIGSRSQGYKFVHSIADVTARTWYEKTGQFSQKKIISEKTGKKITKRTINFFNFNVKLYLKDKIPYEDYEVTSSQNQLSVGKDNFLPITIISDTYEEVVKHEQELSIDEVLQASKEQLFSQLENEISDGAVILSKNIDYTQNQDGTINATLKCECSEQIAELVELDPKEEDLAIEE